MLTFEFSQMFSFFSEFAQFGDQKNFKIKRVAVFELSTSCVRGKDDTTVPGGHREQKELLNYS